MSRESMLTDVRYAIAQMRRIQRATPASKDGTLIDDAAQRAIDGLERVETELHGAPAASGCNIVMTVDRCVENAGRLPSEKAIAHALEHSTASRSACCQALRVWWMGMLLYNRYLSIGHPTIRSPRVPFLLTPNCSPRCVYASVRLAVCV